MGCLNKEKVIKALELEIKYPYTWDCKSECPYYSDTVCDCYTQLATDIIELLKEQEPVRPYKTITGSWLCGACKRYPIEARYCPGCGRKVDWSEFKDD